MAFDLPAGRRRLVQRATGYRLTVKRGAVVWEDGQPTGALPGQLVRGPQAARAQVRSFWRSRARRSPNAEGEPPSAGERMACLSALATKSGVTASTQNQALSALRSWC